MQVVVVVRMKCGGRRLEREMSDHERLYEGQSARAYSDR